MTDFLVKKFIKNPDDIENSKVRQSYGSLSSGVGLVCNILLFLIKYIMGTLSGSISIVSDAFNNLSDSGGCIVTFLGYKMASKPADKDHPFGHGRVEYLTSLILSAIIVIVGFELFKSSAGKIMNPEPVKFSIIVLVSLIISICVKLWMSVFNMKLGKKINSGVMTATAEDSRNDVIATSATVIALISSLFTDFPIDGIMGVIVSLFILKTGFDIIRDTLDELIGKPVQPEIIEKIKNSIISDSDIIDIHDLVIHNYGVTKMIGSCHIEIRSDMSFQEVHEIADRTERRIYSELNIMMTIHTDPVDIDDEQTRKYKAVVKDIVSSMNQGFSIHDFRMVSCENHKNLIFDITVPYECKISNEKIQHFIDKKLEEYDGKYYTIITFDREYC
ncbi:MAG: cation diffusion facilitator family transporter [Oscillospiraceae bacterium]|nr:cation diffusion facilitator family transporter [Oscillospiraceae bacterium]